MLRGRLVLMRLAAADRAAAVTGRASGSVGVGARARPLEPVGDQRAVTGGEHRRRPPSWQRKSVGVMRAGSGTGRPSARRARCRSGGFRTNSGRRGVRRHRQLGRQAAGRSGRRPRRQLRRRDGPRRLRSRAGRRRLSLIGREKGGDGQRQSRRIDRFAWGFSVNDGHVRATLCPSPSVIIRLCDGDPARFLASSFPELTDRPPSRYTESRCRLCSTAHLHHHHAFERSGDAARVELTSGTTLIRTAAPPDPAGHSTNI